MDKQDRSYQRYHLQYHPERFEGFDSRYAETYDRRQPQHRLMNIGDALRQYCGVSAKKYFVAVVLEDDTPAYFSGPDGSTLEPELIGEFFSESRYHRTMELMNSGESVENIKVLLNDPVAAGHRGYSKPLLDYNRSRVLDRRRQSNLEDWDSGGRMTRKRLRGQQSLDDTPTSRTTSRRGIFVENAQDLWDFYEQRFKNCQQTACKLIAKAWVKAVEPKKQSTHPYTGSDEKAPDWWPKPWGPTKEDKVRHKEPDHLYKRERVYLLNHLLNMVIEPKQRQHPDIQKLNLNVKKLEEITMDALSGFFADKENPSNNRKKPYLTEIFRVARQQERFKNDEIDGTTQIFVLAEDKVIESFTEENDDLLMPKEEEDVSNAAMPMPRHVTPHSMGPTVSQGPASDAGLHRSSLLGGDLPVRPNQFTAPQPLMSSEMAPEHHAFGEGNNLPVNSQASVHPASESLSLDVGVDPPHSSSRRPSIFTPPTDSAGMGGTGIYTPQWQSGSTASNTSSLYSFAQQHGTHSPTTFVNPIVPITQNQPYLGNSFDPLSRGYDTGQSTMFRTTAVSQPPVAASATYDYMPNDSRDLPEIKTDPASRNPNLIH